MTSIVTPEARQRVRGIATPIAMFLGRLGLTPNGLTVIGFLGTCVAAWAAASQLWLLCGVLVLVFGIFDLFDGTLARATGKVSRFGAFLDSTLDRAGEAIVYVGIGIGCLNAAFAGGAVLAAAAMGAAFMVSYTRAKSESLGFTPGTGMANIGLAPREVRIAILVVGLFLTSTAGAFANPCVPSATGTCDIFMPAGFVYGSTYLGGTLFLISILATVTAIQRMLHVRAQARED
ncbi:MAG TPA: CDP-alcohol phosphatidyltransferase family protein [Candidatus Limnocylindrales bacterium]|nr:CDP-alcohol phosphatidyltransferase family protein [Candidatus Limnocylindrales bacterium]